MIRESTKPAVWDGEEHAIFADGTVKKMTAAQIAAVRAGEPVALAQDGSYYPLKVGDRTHF